MISTGYMREVAACVVSDGTVYRPKNSLSVGVNGDRMSSASVLGQEEIAIFESSVRGFGAVFIPPALGRDHGDRSRDGEYRDRLHQLSLMTALIVDGAASGSRRCVRADPRRLQPQQHSLRGTAALLVTHSTERCNVWLPACCGGVSYSW